jgi:hypothetical protein
MICLTIFNQSSSLRLNSLKASTSPQALNIKWMLDRWPPFINLRSSLARFIKVDKTLFLTLKTTDSKLKSLICSLLILIERYVSMTLENFAYWWAILTNKCVFHKEFQTCLPCQLYHVIKTKLQSVRLSKTYGNHPTKRQSTLGNILFSLVLTPMLWKLLLSTSPLRRSMYLPTLALSSD